MTKDEKPEIFGGPNWQNSKTFEQLLAVFDKRGGYCGKKGYQMKGAGGRAVSSAVGKSQISPCFQSDWRRIARSKAFTSGRLAKCPARGKAHRFRRIEPGHVSRNEHLCKGQVFITAPNVAFGLHMPLHLPDQGNMTRKQKKQYYVVFKGKDIDIPTIFSSWYVRGYSVAFGVRISVSYTWCAGPKLANAPPESLAISTRPFRLTKKLLQQPQIRQAMVNIKSIRPLDTTNSHRPLPRRATTL